MVPKLNQLKKIYKIEVLKMLVNKALSYLIGVPWAISSFIILSLLRPFYVIRITEIETRKIGHLILPMEIYFSERDVGIGSCSSCIDIYYRNKHISNQFVYQKISRNLIVLPEYILKPVHLFLLKYIPGSVHLTKYRHWRNYSAWQAFDTNNVLLNSKHHITFTHSEIEKCDKIFRRDIFSESSKFVCIFSRDSQYHGDTKQSNRNSPINLYIKTIRTLAEYGYKTIRMGRSSQGMIDLEENFYFDYSRSEIKCDMMDVYIMSKCDFMISTGSGVDTIAESYRKPMILVNYSDWANIEYFHRWQVPLFLPKICRLKESDELLPPELMKKFGVQNFNYLSQYSDIGVDLCDLDEDDINDVILEYLALDRTSQYYGYDQSERFMNLFFDKKKSTIHKIPLVGKRFLEKYYKGKI